MTEPTDIQDPFLPFHKEDVEGSIPQRFAEVVKRWPDNIALRHGKKTLTYRELDEISGRIARAILARLGGGQEPVVLLLGRGVGVITALLGVLKAGKGYVALRPGDPPGHLRRIVHRLGSKLLVTDDLSRPLALEVVGSAKETLSLDELAAVAGATKDISPVLEGSSLAAVFFTSGSSGAPKGVIRDHRSLLHGVWSNRKHYRLGANDRYFDPFAEGFIASAIAVFDSLLNGATLCLYDPQTEPVHDLVESLEEHGITFLHPTLTLFREMADCLTGKERLHDLRFVALSGENLLRHDVKTFEERFPPQCALLHRFSSTETGIISCSRIQGDDEALQEVIPAGFPTVDKEILLLDSERMEVAKGSVGEIAVRSHYLASGYWGDPDLTRERFLPDEGGTDQRTYLTGDLGRLRDDGGLEHLGRKDSQAKIRGYTVPLPAVEGALLEVEGVKQALVVTQDRGGDTHLVAYLVPSGPGIPTATVLRQSLSESLPDYMIPTDFSTVESIPLTNTGKVDRAKLPTTGGTRGELDTPFMAPRTKMEEEIAGLWCEVLDLDRVGVNDRLLDLAANSLTIMKIVNRLRIALKVELEPAVLFRAPTVATLAGHLERFREESGRAEP